MARAMGDDGSDGDNTDNDGHANGCDDDCHGADAYGDDAAAADDGDAVAASSRCTTSSAS